MFFTHKSFTTAGKICRRAFMRMKYQTDNFGFVNFVVQHKKKFSRVHGKGWDLAPRDLII